MVDGWFEIPTFNGGGDIYHDGEHWAIQLPHQVEIDASGNAKYWLNSVTEWGVQGKAYQVGQKFLYSDFWNSPIARWAVPDVITIDANLSATLGIGQSATWTYNIVTRGRDFGIHDTFTGQNRYGLEIDHGFNAGFLY